MLASRIATWLQKNGWVLNLLFIALGAYFVAGAANAVLARSIRVVPTGEERTPARAASRTVAALNKSDYSAMAERNLFAAKREAPPPEGVATAEEGMVVGRDFREEELRPCTFTMQLRATMVADNLPEWSMAVAQIGGDPEAKIFSSNEGRNKMADDAAIVEIRARAVVIRRRDHFELCRSEGEENKGAANAAVIPSPALAEGEAENSGGGPGVTKVSETDYRVERAELDRALGNLNEVATQARIVPSFKNGKANGFKMFSIKPGSIYSKIGLQNGDIIQKINGYEMNSPDKALEIYAKLRDASNVAIELQRRGQNMNMSYAIGP